MIDIFICDDDENITDYLKFFLMKHYGDSVSVSAFSGCLALIGMVQMNEHVPDILIMDINLRDGNGIETIKEIQAEYPQIKVIYLTGILQYATEIFQTSPTYFLTKPINENKLADAVEKAIHAIENDKTDSIVIKTNGSEIILYRKEIMYVESQGRKLIFYLSTGAETAVYEKMDTMEEQLGASFVRSHKSFLINMKYISGRSNQEFYLTDGKVLPISKPHLRDAKLKFISYLGEFV